MEQQKPKNQNIKKEKEFDLFCHRLAEIIFFELENNKNKIKQKKYETKISIECNIIKNKIL